MERMMTDREIELSLSSFDFLLLYIQKGLYPLYENKNDGTVNIEDLFYIITSIQKSAEKKGLFVNQLEKAINLINPKIILNKFKTGAVL